MKPILPGATIGILGGGQLGRMTALAARPLGYRIAVLDPDAHCAARSVADEVIEAPFSDADAIGKLAKVSNVLTIEIEKVSSEGMNRAAKLIPTRPSDEVLHIVQEKTRQKEWLVKNGFPVGPFRTVSTEKELGEAVEALGEKCFVKSSHGGYDGRGQIETTSSADAKAAWESLGKKPCVVEKTLRLEKEISVCVARHPDGTSATYAPALNHHENRILAYSVIPAPIPTRLASEARDLVEGIASAMNVEGLLVAELFVCEGDKLLVNELAPRPHNSFHSTIEACATSQFEQLVRTICDLPFGNCEVIRPTAIFNLLGDLWGKKEPPFEKLFALKNVHLHLYGKTGARPGRKMGHLSATGATPDEALAIAKSAYALVAG